VTAISAGAYPHVAERYILLPHGASMGDGYGPIVVARDQVDLRDVEIVIPGRLTTAYLVLRLALGDVRVRELPFDEIVDEVTSGRADAGLLIHEGQLTYSEAGLRKLLDLGTWWQGETGLPLPLGVTVARRDLDRLADISAVLGEAIQAGLDNRDEALEYAEGFGRGIDRETADRFVAMYVNERTTGYGEEGRRGDRRVVSPRRLWCRGDVCLRLRRSSSVQCARRSGDATARSRGVRPDDLAAGRDRRGGVTRRSARRRDRRRVARLRESGG